MPVKVETVDNRSLLRKRFSVLLAFIALTLASILANQASGQEGDYFTTAMPEKYADSTKLKRLESQVNLALSDSRLTPQSPEWKAAEEYYTRYFMYLMAQPEPGAKLTAMTYEALQHLERAAQSATPEFRKALHGWIRNSAETAAAGQVQGKYFRPVARVNATLLLAHLDTKPAQGGNPPVPDVAVAETLVKKLYESKDAPVGVRVMALSGIRRQSVLLGPAMSDGLRGYYLTKGRELLDGKPPAGLEPDKMEPAAFAFIQRYAVDIVRSLGAPDDHKWLAAKLTEIVSQKDSSPVIALYAARVLPTLKDGVKGLQVTPTIVVSWADRAAIALADELQRLKSLERPKEVKPQQSLAQATARAGAGAGGMMMEGYGGMAPPSDMGMLPEMEMRDPMMMGPGMPGMEGMFGAAPAANPQPPEVIAARRRINANLEALLLGLAGSLDATKPGPGLAAVAEGENKAQIEDLLATLRTAAGEVNNPAHDDRVKFVTMLETNADLLGDWVDSRRPAEEAPQPAAPQPGTPQPEGPKPPAVATAPAAGPAAAPAPPAAAIAAPPALTTN